MFEWDDAKNASNIAKHGLSFNKASQIFDGPVVTAIDDRFDYGEVRRISIGAIGPAIIIVVTYGSQWKHPHNFRPSGQETRKGTVCRSAT